MRRKPGIGKIAERQAEQQINHQGTKSTKWGRQSGATGKIVIVLLLVIFIAVDRMRINHQGTPPRWGEGEEKEGFCVGAHVVLG